MSTSIRGHIASHVRLLSLVLAVLTGVSAVSRGSADSAVLGSSGPPPPPPGVTSVAATPAPVRPAPDRYSLVVVVDAARFDEFDLAKMPNLARLAQRGSRYTSAWVGQLPSITETSHASIGTGVLPSRHQILGDTWRVPGTNSMAPNLLNGQLTRTGYIGQFIRQTSAPSLATIIHQRWPGSRVVSLSAHKVYAADAMGAGSADFVSFGMKDSRGHFIASSIPGHQPDPAVSSALGLDLATYPRVPGVEDAWATTLALTYLKKYRPRVMMVNLPEVDTVGHLAGTDASLMQPLLSRVDTQIGRLVAGYTQAGILNRTDIVITSDHGMIPGNHLVTTDTLHSVITSAGGDPLAIGHGDYCTIYLKNAVAIPAVGAAFVRAAIPYVTAVFARDTHGKYSLISPVGWLADPKLAQTYDDLLRTLNTGESPDLVLFYGENTMTMSPTLLLQKRKGDHGGATWGAQHIPLILAGPGIKRNYVSSAPARLVDVAPTIETLLSARPQNQDGVALADAMTQPPTWATVAQAKVTPRLAEDVAAMSNAALNRPNLRP